MTVEGVRASERGQGEERRERGRGGGGGGGGGEEMGLTGWARGLNHGP